MKLKFLFFLFVLVTAGFSSAQTPRRSPYLGYKYKAVLPGKTLPNGVTEIGGSLIGDINADPVHEIASVQKRKTRMLWLNVSTGQDSGGVTGWKVLDVISFPALVKTDYLFFTGDPAIGCTRSGKEIPNLVGVGKILRKRAIFQPSKLWVADLKTKKFKSISTSGIKCGYSEP